MSGPRSAGQSRFISLLWALMRSTGNRPRSISLKFRQRKWSRPWRQPKNRLRLRKIFQCRHLHLSRRSRSSMKKPHRRRVGRKQLLRSKPPRQPVIPARCRFPVLKLWLFLPRNRNTLTKRAAVTLPAAALLSSLSIRQAAMSPMPAWLKVLAIRFWITQP